MYYPSQQFLGMLNSPLLAFSAGLDPLLASYGNPKFSTRNQSSIPMGNARADRENTEELQKTVYGDYTPSFLTCHQILHIPTTSLVTAVYSSKCYLSQKCFPLQYTYTMLFSKQVLPQEGLLAKEAKHYRTICTLVPEDLRFRQQVPQLLGWALGRSITKYSIWERSCHVPLLERGARAEQTLQKKRHQSNSKSNCLVMSAHSSDRRRA